MRECQLHYFSYVEPCKPVITQCLAHCIKEAGIDIGVFKAHSVRGASASAAVNKGAHISNILIKAENQSFYYHSSSDDNSFA